MSCPCEAEDTLKRRTPATSEAAAWRRARRGFALINALLLLAIMTLLLSVSITYTQNSLKASRSVKYNAQAYNMARAGIADTINWFKSQQRQPVQTFGPTPNPLNPTLANTADPYNIDPGGARQGEPCLGIVQEICLDPASNIWGRYEVGKLTRLDKDSKGVPRDYYVWDATNGWVSIQNLAQATSNSYEGVLDVSNLYGYAQGSGLVWRIYSHGYVYRRDPSTVPGTTPQLFFQEPNQVLEQSTLVTEIRRLNLTDFVTAMYGKTGSQITFNNPNNLLVNAPNAWCVLCNAGTGTPTPSNQPGGFKGQSTSYGTNGNSPLDWTIFGVDNANTLASLADLSVTDISQLPTAMPNMALTYIQPTSGTADFTQSRPLNGGGILVVNGNLILDSGSASSYAGYIYVNGNYTQDAPSDVTGEIVTTGSLTMNAPSDKATVEYNQDLINQIRTELGQYREQRSAIKTVKFDSSTPNP